MATYSYHSLGLLLLRLGMGGLMLPHAWGKLQLLIDGRAAEFADPLGMGSALSLILILLAEGPAALAVMAGWKTRLAALPLIIGMLVAAFIQHAADPWSSKEMALLYLVGFITIALTGPGKYALDKSKR